ncbi:outer membrane lipoprotein-sorting protein [Planctomycetota bacterium]
MKKTLLIVFQIVILLAVSLPLNSDNKEPKKGSAATKLILPKKLDGLKNGREVQIYVRDKYLGDDLVGKKTLFRLTDKRGNVRNRIMNRYVKDFKGVKKYLIRIVKPADVRNIGLLTWEDNNKEGDDTRFLHMPALKKTRRIATKDRGQRFIGSDFTYEDLGTVPVDDYTYTATKTVTYAGKECYFYQCYAKKGSGAVYPKIKTWTSKESWTRIRMEYYDKHGKLWKIFKAEEFKILPAGKHGIWTPHHLIMKNMKDGHQTEFCMRGIKYNNGHSDELFSLQNLDNMTSEQ